MPKTGRSGIRCLLIFAAIAAFSYSSSLFARDDENILGLPELGGPTAGSLVI